jgi:hypothetical protein
MLVAASKTLRLRKELRPRLSFEDVFMMVTKGLVT